MTRSERLERIQQDITESTKKSGREPGSVSLVAVSKTFAADDVAAFAALGHLDFGENKVQEFLRKKEEIDRRLPENNLRWHVIGHLQRNKAKEIVGKTQLFHALDSIKLASSLNLQLDRIAESMDCLVQVNVSGEASKFGIDPPDLNNFLESLHEQPNLRIHGLMTLASPSDNPEDVRGEFAQLRQLSESVQDLFFDPSRVHLSMGMSHYFKVAIEEGATIIRVGSSLFGSRDYSTAPSQ